MNVIRYIVKRILLLSVLIGIGFLLMVTLGNFAVAIYTGIVGFLFVGMILLDCIIGSNV